MLSKFITTIAAVCIVSMSATASETTDASATTQAPAKKDTNLVPLKQRQRASFHGHGASATVPVEPKKTYFIFAKVKLTQQSNDPNPRLRFAIRFKEKSGQLNYKWCEYQSLTADSFAIFATTYTAPEYVEEITVIFNPEFSKEVRACYQDFAIMEVNEEELL